MLYLIASIISSTSIFILFKTSERYLVKLIPLITINYLIASILGILIILQQENSIRFEASWLIFAIVLGIMFIVLFWLIGLSSQRSGITITTLASKMSLIFPVILSMYWFNEAVTFFKVAGIILAIAAVLLSVYRNDVLQINWYSVFLPLLIFIGGGFNDSLIKYVQVVQISEAHTAAFTMMVFATAFILGLIISIAESRSIKLKINSYTLLFGSILGIVNFGSLYFLIQALEKSKLDSSLVFTLNNMLIVVLSGVAGKAIFREQLNRINVAGFLLALLSLAILL